jgi:hypothetical protein
LFICIMIFTFIELLIKKHKRFGASKW